MAQFGTQPPKQFGPTTTTTGGKLGGQSRVIAVLLAAEKAGERALT